MTDTVETLAIAQTVATVLLVGVTVSYVVFTYRLMSISRAQAKFATQPDVVAYLEPHDVFYNIVNLVLRNVGPGTAYDVKLSAEGDDPILDAHPLREVGLFVRGVPVLPSGAKRELFLANAYGGFDALKKLQLAVNVTYRGMDGESRNARFPLDFNEFEKMGTIGENDVHKISEELEKTRKILESWTSSRHLQVDTYTPEQKAGMRWSQKLHFKLRRLQESQRAKIEEEIDEMLAGSQNASGGASSA